MLFDNPTSSLKHIDPIKAQAILEKNQFVQCVVRPRWKTKVFAAV